jgi:tetratricopeptide (TPR) repeat protein
MSRINKTQLALLLALSFSQPLAFADAVTWEKYLKEGQSGLAAGSLDKAVESYRKALDEAKSSGLEPKFVAVSINDLAMALVKAGKSDEAESLFKEAITLKEKTYGAEDESLVSTLGNLGQLYKAAKRYQDARLAYQRAVTIIEKGSDKDVKLIPLVNALAGISIETGELDDAALRLRRVIELARASGDNAALSIAQNNLALVLRKQGKAEEAEALYKDVLAQSGSGNGVRGEDKDLNKAAALNNLARLHREKGEFDQAKPLLLEAYNLLSGRAADEPATVIVTLDNLATVSKELGDYNDAVKYYREALKLQAGVKGLSPESKADTDAVRMTNLALALLSSGDTTESEKLFKDTISTLEAQYGKTSLKLAPALANLGELYRQSEKYDQAEPLLRQAFDIRQAGDAKDPKLADAANDLAILYKEMGREKDSTDYFEKSLAVRENAPDSAELATALNNLARSYREQGAYDKAESLYKRALAIREKVFGADDASVAAVLRNYAKLLKLMGKPADARNLNVRASAIEAKQGQ